MRSGEGHWRHDPKYTSGSLSSQERAEARVVREAAMYRDILAGYPAKKAISVRQPWAWLIVNGYKPVENRSWPTKLRGPVFIHAAKGMTADEYSAALDTVRMAVEDGESPRELLDTFPGFSELERGGIVGMVEIVDCVDHHPSRYFFGPKAFVLANARTTPFIPCRGELSFFEVKL